MKTFLILVGVYVVSLLSACSPEQLRETAKYNINSGNYAAAVNNLEGNPDPEAETMLGDILANGYKKQVQVIPTLDGRPQPSLALTSDVNVPPDLKKSYELYLDAANKGWAPAQYKLGTFYENGTVVDQNTDEAFHWYTLAAAQGDINATNQIDALKSKIKNDKEVQAHADAIAKHAEIEAEKFKALAAPILGTWSCGDNNYTFNNDLSFELVPQLIFDIDGKKVQAPSISGKFQLTDSLLLLQFGRMSFHFDDPQQNASANKLYGDSRGEFQEWSIAMNHDSMTTTIVRDKESVQGNNKNIGVKTVCQRSNLAQFKETDNQSPNR